MTFVLGTATYFLRKKNNLENLSKLGLKLAHLSSVCNCFSATTFILNAITRHTIDLLSNILQVDGRFTVVIVPYTGRSCCMAVSNVFAAVPRNQTSDSDEIPLRFCYSVNKHLGFNMVLEQAS
jgi:hypothetical protein